MKKLAVLALLWLSACIDDSQLTRVKHECEHFCGSDFVQTFQWNKPTPEQRLKEVLQFQYYYACVCDDGSEMGHWSTPRVR